MKCLHQYATLSIKYDHKVMRFYRIFKDNCTGGPCKSRIFGGRGDPRVANPRVTSNVLVLKP